MCNRVKDPRGSVKQGIYGKPFTDGACFPEAIIIIICELARNICSIRDEWNDGGKDTKMAFDLTG